MDAGGVPGPADHLAEHRRNHDHIGLAGVGVEQAVEGEAVAMHDLGAGHALVDVFEHGERLDHGAHDVETFERGSRKTGREMRHHIDAGFESEGHTPAIERRATSHEFAVGEAILDHVASNDDVRDAPPSPR